MSGVTRGTIRSDSTRYVVVIEFSGTNPVYIGLAEPGTATSSPNWQIRKLTFDGSSNPTNIQYANGLADFLSIWDNRAALSYS